MQLIVFHGCLCELEGKLSNPKLTQCSMPLLMLSAVFVTNACNFASGLTSSVMFLNPNSWRLQHHHFFNSIGDSAQCEKWLFISEMTRERFTKKKQQCNNLSCWPSGWQCHLLLVPCSLTQETCAGHSAKCTLTVNSPDVANLWWRDRFKNSICNMCTCVVLRVKK